MSGKAVTVCLLFLVLTGTCVHAQFFNRALNFLSRLGIGGGGGGLQQQAIQSQNPGAGQQQVLPQPFQLSLPQFGQLLGGGQQQQQRPQQQVGVARQQQIRINRFNWQPCSAPGSSLVEITGIDLPNPISIPGNHQLRLVMNIKEPLRSRLSVSVRVTRKAFVFEVPIPCISNAIGSCTYQDICALLEQHYQSQGGRCLARSPLGGGGGGGEVCRCPIPATRGPQQFIFNIPITSGPNQGLSNLLTSGTYTVLVNGNMNGRHAGCIRGEADVQVA